VAVRKVKVLKAPKFDLTKLMEVWGVGSGRGAGLAAARAEVLAAAPGGSEAEPLQRSAPEQPRGAAARPGSSQPGLASPTPHQVHGDYSAEEVGAKVERPAAAVPGAEPAAEAAAE
jgi:hypothetical protein